VSRNAKIALASGVVVALLAAAVVVLAVDDNDDDAAVGVTTTSSTPPTSTSTTTAPTVADLTSAVWPWVNSSTRYTDPVTAATGFATDFVGFVDPVVGEFQQGDSLPSPGRSGEVEVRMKPGLTPTTVLVRQLGNDGTWWVIGASTPNISVDQPAALASISSPVVVKGTSTAFEARVAVEIREDGNPSSISTNGYVMGGSNGEFGPFDDTVEFDPPTARYGAILFSTSSAEDGRIFEATVVRVRFG
jgi:Immunoglobulin-like domain of bacterial spore germination